MKENREKSHINRNISKSQRGSHNKNGNGKFFVNEIVYFINSNETKS